MDEIWERAVETALDGEKDNASARTLTLDGAVKCVQGRLPPPSLLERLSNLEHLSIANVGVSTLEQFPRLWNLQRLILSDNRIAGGLEFLVQAGLDALRDLDLSNNRIQCVEDLAPLAQLKLVSLDLYECPVTRVKDYRARVFGLIKTLKYLDKMDAEENERPESDEEDEVDEEEEEEEDPGSGEIDGEERVCVMSNVRVRGEDGVVDVDEEEESGADEEDVGMVTRPNGLAHHDGLRVEPVMGNDVEEENDSEEEIDDDDNDDDAVEVYEIEDSDDEKEEEEDGVEYDEDEEEVDNDEEGFEEPESSGRLMSTEGEIDGHEQGEEDGDEDDQVETGDDEMGVDYDGEFGEEDEEEDFGDGYLVQPVGQSEALHTQGGSMNGGNDDGEEEAVDDDDDDGNGNDDTKVLPPTSSHHKRKRNDDDDDEQ